MSFNQWPEELVKKPKPLIGLTGLDVENNVIHKSIWESFSKIRRQDRVPLNFSLFPIKHEYPKCKSKRVTYEWYLPKGILKSKWMQKHMEEVPAMIVVFFDMDWDEIQWKEKITECSNLVNIVKKNIQGRATKIVVVLVQKRALMPGEDTFTEQRAQYLCQVCDLQGNRNLFVLPTTESLYGYIIRLEREFLELVTNYYQSQIKKVKSHKEALNKTTHQLLFIRHHFKIAFFQEFRQDHALASKNYKQAYTYILELRMLDTHILEIKTVAGYVNYKICCLSFQNNASDAISQFRKHTDFFKGICGPPDLAYEHESWISKQFEVMGDLFRDAIRQGLVAITTQHPGLYYEEAALHAIARKRFSHPNMITSARRVNRYYNVTDASYILPNVHPSPLPSTDQQQQPNDEQLEFFGQRHWRQGKQSIEPPDPAKEKEAILILQMGEKQIDHSKIIIPLLKSAMEHYQRYKANRMKLMSCVLMGEEFMSCGDYSEALKCFYKVFTDYRSERWYELLTSALLNSLKCTYLTAKMPDYISICLELIGKNIYLNTDDKIRIQNNTNRVLNNELPEVEPGLDSRQLNEGIECWRKKITEFNTHNVNREEFCINMNELSSCVDCKVVFPSAKYPVDKCLMFSIFLRSTAMQPLQIRKIEIILQDNRYNERCSLADDCCTPFNLQPFTVHEFRFMIVPIADEGNHIIRVDKVFVLLGDDMNYCHAFLQWTMSMEEYLKKTFQPSKPDVYRPVNTPLPWSSIHITPFVELVQRESKFSLEIVHCNPILVNESYPIKIAITNHEDIDVYSMQGSIFLEDLSSSSNYSSAKICLLEKVKTDNTNVSVKSSNSKKIEFEITSLGAGEQIAEIICATATSLGSVRLHVEIGYKIKVVVANQSGFCQCLKSAITELNSIQPFEVMTKLLSLDMIPMKDILAGDPFLLQITTSNVSPLLLEIINTNIHLMNEVISLDDIPETDEEDDRITNEKVNSLESVCEVKILKVLQNDIEDPTFVAIGKYSINWRRVDNRWPIFNELSQAKINTTMISLPDCSLDLTPLTVDLNMDSHAICKIPFLMTYVLRNRALYPLEVEVQLDMSDSFMYSGIKFLQVRILPQSEYPLRFNLLPVVSGYLSLPRFHVKLIGSSSQLLLPSSSSQSGDSKPGPAPITIDATSAASAATSPSGLVVMSRDASMVTQIASLERQFEDKFLSRLPQHIFVKPSGQSIAVRK